ncbi:DNA-binding transcriptional LysR family regulator [Ensifer sp. WSM1721]
MAIVGDEQDTEAGLVDDFEQKFDASFWLTGSRRDVASSANGLLAVPEMIAVTDYCATLPSMICRSLVRDPRLKVLAPPVDLDTFPVQMAWHVRYPQVVAFDDRWPRK